MANIANNRSSSVMPNESPEDPWKGKNAERAKTLWSLLRSSVKQSIDLIKKADMVSSTVSHGVHHLRKLNHDDEVIDVVFNAANEEFVTADHHFIRIFHKDGRRKDIVDTGESIVKIVLCSKINQYVGLTAENEMKIFSSDFAIISTTRSPNKINCLEYNESTNEIVTAGSGNVMTWCFRYGGRYLIAHKTITQGLTCKDVFDKVAFESSSSNSQKCYAVCGTGIAVFRLYTGQLLEYKKDLHVRNITSILFFNLLKYVITGSRDGSIKLWTSDFEIRLVFVGHRGPITALKLYPHGPYIMSSSLDCSIRVWSLETCDEVDLIHVDDPVLGLGTTPNLSLLYSFSTYTVDLWTITHVHQIFTTIRNPVQKLKTSTYRQLVDRVVCQNEDGSVRLLSPVDGAVLTTFMAPGPRDDDATALPQLQGSPNTKRRVSVVSTSPIPGRRERFLLDAAYCLPLELLFVTYSDGRLVRATTSVNPARSTDAWQLEGGNRVNCLCFYEYILNGEEIRQVWEEIKSGASPASVKRQTRYGYSITLLAGRRDGCICKVNVMTGETEYEVEAHGVKGVIGITANVRLDQVITAGKDNVVKVWRMFPNAKECLNLLMSFYCAHTPLYMSICGTKLAVGFQQLATATYTIVMYDLESKKRFDHAPHDDHVDELTGLSCCPRLKLFASASRDGNVRVWGDNNDLFRILKLNEEPRSVDFCNETGDLLVGINDNLHRIDHRAYLPKVVLFKMVCMQFPEALQEVPLPVDDRAVQAMDDVVRRKFLVAKSSYMKMDYQWDPRTDEEQQDLDVEEQRKHDAYQLLRARDAELTNMKDGLVQAKRSGRRPHPRAESIAFKKYMALFYNRPTKMQIPDEGVESDADLQFTRKSTPHEFIPEEKTGFFPPIKDAKPVKHILASEEVGKEKHLTESGPCYSPRNKYIIEPSGFIPNSILIKLLWPVDAVKKAAEELWKPPELSEDQLLMLQHMNEAPSKKRPLVQSVKWSMSQTAHRLSLWNAAVKPSLPQVKMVDASTEMSQAMLDQQKKWLSMVTLPSSADSDFFDEDAGFVMESDAESALVFEDDDVIAPSAGATISQVQGAMKGGEKKKKKVDKKPSSLMEKLTRAMKTPTPPPKEPTPPPTPPPPKETKIRQPTRPTKPIVKLVSRPPPPKPPTPIPTPPSPTPPPPTPPPTFLTQFEDLPWYVRHKDYMFQRLNKPYAAGAFFKIVCDVLGISIDWDHRSAIADALLLLWQQEGIRETRHLLASLNSILQASVPPDPKQPAQAQFLRSATNLYKTVAGGSEDLVIELLTQYLQSEQAQKNFLRGVLLEQGLKDPRGLLMKEIETWEVWDVDAQRPLKPQLRDIVVRWYDEWKARFQGHLQQTLQQLQSGGQVKGKMRALGQSRTSEAKKRVHFNVTATESSLKTVQAIEVVNYFCEMMLEEELERIRLANIKPDPIKNTVLVLPKLEGKQAIVRLGEMHTARRLRARRSQLSFEYRINPLVRPYPDLMATFTNKLHLPFATVAMNPFPSPTVDQFEETSDYYQPILLTLRNPTHQKYFVPEQSYVHMA